MTNSATQFDDTVQIDGEPYHLILMPAFLPNGASTLRQMLSALLKTFQTARGGMEEEERKLFDGYGLVKQEELLQAISGMEVKLASML